MPQPEPMSPAQITLARKIYRQGGTTEQAHAAVGSRLSMKSFQLKMKRLGIPFERAPRIHSGTAKCVREAEF